MDTSEALLVIITVDRDVEFVVLVEVFHHVFDVLHAAGTSAHSLGRVVAVTSRTIPVGEQLGSERYDHIEVFSNTLNEVAGDPQMVTNIDTLARTDLILKLTRHYFDISSRNVDTSEEASLVVRISNSATVASVGTNGAVVGTLLTRVTIVGPAKRLLSELSGVSEESVLLLNTVPSFLSRNFRVVPNLVSEVSEISVGRHELLEGFIFPVESLTQDDDVVATTEGVSEHSARLEDDFRVFGDGLISRAAIIVPFGAFSNAGGFLFEGASLRADIDAGTTNPHVFSDDLAILWEVVEGVRELVVAELVSHR